MAHGGARSRSGPAPDPNAIRRDRPDDQASWITLPAERTGPIPDWPLPGDATPPEIEQWEKLWRLPQATVWEAEGIEDDVALYVRSWVEAARPDAAVNLRNMVRVMRDDLGLSRGSMLRLRWVVEGATTPAATATASPAAARPASRGKSSRDRFRVVKPPEDA